MSQTMPSPGTHWPPLWCLGFLLLHLLPHPPPLTCSLDVSLPCPAHPYTLSPVFCLNHPNRPFSGPSQTPVLVSVGLVSGHMRAKRFHSFPRVSQWELRSTLPFPACFLYNPKFRLASCSACHLLSHWYFAQLIIPWRWRWRQCSSETSAHFHVTTWRYSPEDITLHNHRCKNFKSNDMNREDGFCLSKSWKPLICSLIVGSLHHMAQ
jgi:hypothetical protein